MPAGDERLARADERNRVVLAPRRWRQAPGTSREWRWQNSPVTGESTYKP